MGVKNNFRTLLVIVMLCMLVFLSVNSFANAQDGRDTDADLQNAANDSGDVVPNAVVPGGPGFIMVNTSLFRPHTLSDQWAFTGSGIYNPNRAAISYLLAGLTLPHGATITKITLYYYDNVADKDIYLSLFRNTPDGKAYQISSLYSENASTSWRDRSTTAILTPVVDNQNYSYSLYLGIPESPTPTTGIASNLIVSNVRIDYAFPQNLPLVGK